MRNQMNGEPLKTTRPAETQDSELAFVVLQLDGIFEESSIVAVHASRTGAEATRDAGRGRRIETWNVDV